MGPYVGEAWGGAVSSLCVSRSVRDTAAYLDNVKGPSLGDMYYVRQPETPYLVGSKLSPGKLKIGYSLAHPFPGQTIDSECRTAVLEAVKLLQDLGHTVEEVDLPYQKEVLTKHFFFMVISEVAAEIEHVTKLRGKKSPDINDFEITTWLIGQLGNQFSGKQYAQAKRGWHDLAVDMANFHLNYDFLLTPTLSRPPVTIGELKTKPMEEMLFKAVSQIGLIGMVKNLSIIDEMALRSYNYLPFTPIANMTGQPSMSVPLHWQQSTSLPVGVMFTGRMCEETRLLQLANQLEQARPWFDKVPNI
jgi:amidase